MSFVNLLNVIGVKKFEDLLFKCRSDLIGKARDVKAIKSECAYCHNPNVISWEYTIDGKPQRYEVSKVCTNCLNGRNSKEISKQITKEFEDKRRSVLEQQWYMIPESDNSGLKNYESYSKATARALEVAKTFTIDALNNKLDSNLVILGSPGTGKSHLSKAIARTLKEKGLDVAYIEAVKLFDYIKGTFNSQKEYERLMSQFKAFQVVFIDDLGLETIKIQENSWTVREWTNLINARAGKATVYTSNYDDGSLAKVIGDRAVSRMYTKSKWIDLFTDDYRKRLQIS